MPTSPARYAHTSASSRSPLAPTAPPSLVHDSQEPHLLDPGSLEFRSPELSVPIEEALVSEKRGTHSERVGGGKSMMGWAAGGCGMMLLIGMWCVQ